MRLPFNPIFLIIRRTMEAGPLCNSTTALMLENAQLTLPLKCLILFLVGR